MKPPRLIFCDSMMRRGITAWVLCTLFAGGATQATAQNAFSGTGRSSVLSGPPAGMMAVGSAISPARSRSLSNGTITPDSKQVRSTPRGNTYVAIGRELETLYREGGVPESLATLRLLQQQQQRVAKLAESCTVSVQIGPAQGGGVIITDTGYVLTAAHVAMRPKKSAVLTLSDGRTVTATTLGMNRMVDAGLMKIDPGQNEGRTWPHATLGTSKNLKSGMWAIATGHPGGYDASRGMVTRVGRILAVREGSIVTDCALIGGDSGGPLFDLSGRLIAVHSRIGNDVADNLHVPVSHYDESWSKMERGEAWGFLPGFRPRLGVSGNGSSNVAEVLSVAPGSPAARAGLKTGDVIEAFGERTITNFKSLKEAVADTMPGERVRVYLRRDGQARRVTLEIGRADD
ncbi:MAG: trypsin-like peptidase domain-containing protein [Planctomycetota bacterium]